jgi:hypothetical protein
VRAPGYEAANLSRVRVDGLRGVPLIDLDQQCS